MRVKYIGHRNMAGIFALIVVAVVASKLNTIAARAPASVQAELSPAAKERCERVLFGYQGRLSYLAASLEPADRSISVLNGSADLHTKYQAYREWYAIYTQSITDGKAMAAMVRNDRECFPFVSARELDDKIAAMVQSVNDVDRIARARGIIQ